MASRSRVRRRAVRFIHSVAWLRIPERVEPRTCPRAWWPSARGFAAQANEIGWELLRSLGYEFADREIIAKARGATARA
jgi:hypothetical protein